MSKTSVKQAVSEFLLSCKVKGKSYGIIEYFYVNSWILPRACREEKETINGKELLPVTWGGKMVSIVISKIPNLELISL